MKLWVDDERPKPQDFDIWAKTADEAIRILNLGGVTEISLDHDLGSLEKTGYSVAVWIEAAASNGYLAKLKWSVHSANPPGRRNIEMALRKADEFWDGSEVIDRFSGEFEFLSNFYMAPVMYEGEEYPSSEHAFQAAKSLDPMDRRKVKACGTPGQAKYTGRRVIKLRPDWEAVKNQAMEDIVRDKFTRHEDLRKKLLDTGDVQLIEGNTWNDRTWGMVRNADGVFEGENRLGKILMKVREQLRG